MVGGVDPALQVGHDGVDGGAGAPGGQVRAAHDGVEARGVEVEQVHLPARPPCALRRGVGERVAEAALVGVVDDDHRAHGGSLNGVKLNAVRLI